MARKATGRTRAAIASRGRSTTRGKSVTARKTAAFRGARGKLQAGPTRKLTGRSAPGKTFGSRRTNVGTGGGTVFQEGPGLKAASEMSLDDPRRKKTFAAPGKSSSAKAGTRAATASKGRSTTGRARAATASKGRPARATSASPPRRARGVSSRGPAPKRSRR